MKIDFANLQYQYQLYKDDIDKNIQAVLNKSNYILGEEVQDLERQLEAYTALQHSITCSSGTDALLLALMAMDIKPGDEVITTTFSFIATAETISLAKATPIFVDIDEDTFNINDSKIEQAITAKTKAIIVVSLYGQPANMDNINSLAKKHDLKVIIDGAQSFGALYSGKHEGHFCDIYTTSFFPAKPLGCYGDGGAVFTNNDEYAKKIRMMRVHGQNKRYHHKYIGIGGRLDTIQAAVLLAKLPHYKKEIGMRQRVAERYNELLGSCLTPIIKAGRNSVWAQYTIRTTERDRLQEKLAAKGVPSAVHYPIALHMQECFQFLGYKQGDFPMAEKLANEVLSLPMNPFVTEDELSFITTTVMA